ncbi:hypothetical protein [Mesorhizobium helmanticense]|nr:hypothetical protein [Mesorhizobium helmanticense]
MISAGSTPSWDRKAGEWLAKSVPPQPGVDHQNLARARRNCRAAAIPE